MPMVNSFGARKKAPYADALSSRTTAAALRTLLVMIFLDLCRPSPVIPFSKCFVFTQIPETGGEGGTPPNHPVSFLQEIFPEKPYRRQKNDVKRNQERQPIPTQHRLLREERGRRLRTGDEQRRQQRQQKQWQQQFAHARLRGNRRQRRPRDGKPEATQEQHQCKLRHNSKQGNVVEHRENREHQQFRDQQEKGVRAELRQKNRKGIGNGKTQRAERVVGLLAQKTRLEHQ